MLNVEQPQSQATDAQESGAQNVPQCGFSLLILGPVAVPFRPARPTSPEPPVSYSPCCLQGSPRDVSCRCCGHRALGSQPRQLEVTSPHGHHCHLHPVTTPSVQVMRECSQMYKQGCVSENLSDWKAGFGNQGMNEDVSEG